MANSAEKEKDTASGAEVAGEKPEETDGGKQKKKREKKKRSKGRIIIVLVVVLLCAGIAALLTWLTLTEYKPAERETLSGPQGAIPVGAGSTFRITTLNTGYGALSAEADFFMDGGSGVRAESQEQVEQNLGGIVSMLADQQAQVYLLQEVDVDSARSYGINEESYYESAMGLPGVYACNYRCRYVPYPIPPLGRVDSGLVTLTDFHISGAERIQLPFSTSWPVRLCTLKRCLLVERIPIEGTDRQLVLVNLHLEAYDTDGKDKKAQTKILRGLLEQEYGKGNYVIAGGDFNQTFEGAGEFPAVDLESWAPGELTFADCPQGFSFVFDPAVPTCRLLSAPYTGDYETSQVYTLDGFLVSGNVAVLEAQAADYQFQFTDHQPVTMTVTLMP